MKCLQLSVVFLAIASSALAQNGYNYDRPQKPLTSGGPSRYPETSPSADYPTSQHGRPSGPTTPYPSGGQSGYPSGKPSGPGFPAGSQGSVADYPTPQGPSPSYGPPGASDDYPSAPGAATGGYPGAQRPGQHGGAQGGYPSAQRPAHGGSQGGYPGAQHPQGGHDGHDGQPGGFPAADTPVAAGFPGGRPGQRPSGGAQIGAQRPAHGGAQGGVQHGGSQGGYPGAQRPAHGGAQGGYPGAQGGSQHGGAQGGYPGAQGGSQHGGAQGGIQHGGAQGGYPGAQGGSQQGGAQGGYPGAQGGNQQGQFGNQGGSSNQGTFFDEQGSENEGDYSAIPGEPDVDYPIYTEIPQTSFRCANQQYPGYYADVEARCQVFHICANNLTYDFLCPNGTIFHQQHFVCVWWNQFDCNTAESLYELNANIYDYSITGASENKPYQPSGIIGVQHPNDYQQNGNQNRFPQKGQQGQGQGYPGASGKPQGQGYPSGPAVTGGRPQGPTNDYPESGHQGYPSQQKPQGPSNDYPESGHQGYPSQQKPGAGHHEESHQQPGYPRPGQQRPQADYPEASGPQGYPQQKPSGFQPTQNGNGYPKGPQNDQHEQGHGSNQPQHGGYPQQKPSGPTGHGFNKPQQHGHADEGHAQSPSTEYGTPSRPQSDHHEGGAQGYPSGRPNVPFTSGTGSFPAGGQADSSFEKPNREYLPPRSRRMSPRRKW